MTNSDTIGDEQGARDSAASRLRETAGEARERAAAAYASARERAASAYESARDGAARATRRTAEGIEANPVAAVVGGLAVGALVAALLPRTDGEGQALGKLGRKLVDGAKDAAASAREAGSAKLGEFGIDQAKDKISELVGGKKA